MPWNAKRWLGFGTVLALTGIAACTIEVNINTKSDDAAEAPIAAEAPTPPGEVAPPTRPPSPPSGAPPAPPPPPPEPGELRESPTFTPFTKAPSILNRAEIVQAMAERYPPLLRDAGIGGTARVYFFIEADGRVGNVLLDQGSGHPALDAAALAVARVYRFSPALNRDAEVPVWVSFPITFQVR